MHCTELSLYSPFDEDYEHFFTSIGEELNDALSATIRRQLELREQQKNADLQQVALEQRLVKQTEQARNMEQRFTRLVTTSPAAVSIVRSDGYVKYVR